MRLTAIEQDAISSATELLCRRRAAVGAVAELMKSLADMVVTCQLGRHAIALYAVERKVLLGLEAAG